MIHPMRLGPFVREPLQVIEAETEDRSIRQSIRALQDASGFPKYIPGAMSATV